VVDGGRKEEEAKRWEKFVRHPPSNIQLSPYIWPAISTTNNTTCSLPAGCRSIRSEESTKRQVRLALATVRGGKSLP